MAWDSFKRIRFRKKKDMPGGLWMRCPGCENMQYKRAVEERLRVCPECNYHLEISARERVGCMLDPGSFEEVATGLLPLDPLDFRAVKSYGDRLKKAQQATGLDDACIVGTGRLAGSEIRIRAERGEVTLRVVAPDAATAAVAEGAAARLRESN